jgi:hypothetical protein
MWCAEVGRKKQRTALYAVFEKFSLGDSRKRGILIDNMCPVGRMDLKRMMNHIAAEDGALGLLATPGLRRGLVEFQNNVSRRMARRRFNQKSAFLA